MESYAFKRFSLHRAQPHKHTPHKQKLRTIRIFVDHMSALCFLLWPKHFCWCAVPVCIGSVFDIENYGVKYKSPLAWKNRRNETLLKSHTCSVRKPSEQRQAVALNNFFFAFSFPVLNREKRR